MHTRKSIVRSTFHALICTAVLSAVWAGSTPPAHALDCSVPLKAVGPIDPANGFPLYYQDSTRLALQPCLDAVCGGAGFVLPDPNLPLSFPGNFPVAVVYWRAISKMTVGTISVVYVSALEGSFANGVQALPGDQVVFSRIRIRIFGATPGGTYTVTHPYGVEVLTADGFGTVNFTQDSPRIPVGLGGPALAFGTALSVGRVGPFLRAVAPVPPPGLIGNPAANQTVTGSPCGTNILRVEGPGFPVGGQQTDQFKPLVGRRHPICGDGFLDAGEQCDDGNVLDGDCCSSTCQLEPNGIPCQDGDACTTGDTCSAGTCIGGPPPNCDDGNQCTADSCDHALGCQNLAQPNDTPCDDGQPVICSLPYTCQEGLCTAGGGDMDGDQVCNDDDNCPSVANTNQADLDGDGVGNACDPVDATIALGEARIQHSSEPAQPNDGRIILKGTFQMGPSEGPFSDAAGISVRVQDGLGLDYTVSWSPGRCADSGTRIRCRSGRGWLRGTFWQLPSGPGQYGFYISLSQVDLHGMLQGPVTVDIRHGDSIDRVGTLDACAPSTPAAMVRCRAPVPHPIS